MHNPQSRRRSLLSTHDASPLRFAPRKASARFQPNLEVLEDRTVPVVTASFSAGLLTVNLGAASDHAFISFDGANYDVGTFDGGSNVYNGTDGTGNILVQDKASAAGQAVTFSGANVIPVGTLTVTGVETAHVKQNIGATVNILGNATTVNVYPLAGVSDVIQDGIKLTKVGGTVDVKAGLYQISKTILIDRSLTLRGPQANVDPRAAAALRTAGGAGEAIIDGDTTGDGFGDINTLLRIGEDPPAPPVSNVTINGLEFRNARSDIIETEDSTSQFPNPSLAPRATRSTGIVIRYNFIHNSDTNNVPFSQGDDAIQIRNSSAPVVEFNNIFDTQEDAIVYSFTDNGIIRFNEISDSRSQHGAIYVYNNGFDIGGKGLSVLIEGNYIHDLLKSRPGDFGRPANWVDAIQIGDDELIDDFQYPTQPIDRFLVGGTIRNNKIENVAGSAVNNRANGDKLTIFDNFLSEDGLNNPNFFTVQNETDGTFINASANWWGVNTPAGVASGVTVNGGTFVLPNGNTKYDSGKGAISGGVDYTPWFDVATDTSGTILNGFQGNFAILHVDDDSPQTGLVARVQEGVNLVTAGGEVRVRAGMYPENVIINKDLTLIGFDGVGVTFVNPGSGTAITVNSGASSKAYIRQLTISAGAAGTGVLVNSGAKARMDDNIIDGNRFGVDVNGGTAFLQGNSLSNNNTGSDAMSVAAGLRVRSSGIVDAGQIVGGVCSDFTGLGGGFFSTGGNVFNGYTPYKTGSSGYPNVPTSTSQAIINLNTGATYSISGPQGIPLDVMAQGNTFNGLDSSIVANLCPIDELVYHDEDSATRGFVNYVSVPHAIIPGSTLFYNRFENAVDVAVQRSMISKIRLSFSNYVVISPGALSLEKTADATTKAGSTPDSFVDLGPVVVMQSTTTPINYDCMTGEFQYTLQFTNNGVLTIVEPSGSLSDGLYKLSLDESLINGNSNCGPGIGMGVTDIVFHRLFGDVTGSGTKPPDLANGVVNTFDQACFQLAAGSKFFQNRYRDYLDYDNDLDIDAADSLQFSRRLNIVTVP